MYRMNEREQALLCVQQLGFMTDDLRLFLNTHPECEEAFDALKYFMAAERDKRKQYEMHYGPLTLEGTENHDCYSWIHGAWPWETEA